MCFVHVFFFLIFFFDDIQLSIKHLYVLCLTSFSLYINAYATQIVNDLVKVTPGSRIPCDGVIQHGTSSVDESMLTGEPLPKVKRPEDKVTSGTMNLSSLIIIRATHVGSDTALSRIMRLVEDAQTTKAPVQAAADVVSKVFVPAVVLISLATFAVWIVVGTLNPALVPEDTNVLGFALQFAVTVLVVACPCALGLATPTAVMVGTGSEYLFVFCIF